MRPDTRPRPRPVRRRRDRHVSPVPPNSPSRTCAGCRPAARCRSAPPRSGPCPWSPRPGAAAPGRTAPWGSRPNRQSTRRRGRESQRRHRPLLGRCARVFPQVGGGRLPKYDTQGNCFPGCGWVYPYGDRPRSAVGHRRARARPALARGRTARVRRRRRVGAAHADPITDPGADAVLCRTNADALRSGRTGAQGGQAHHPP